MKVEIIEPKEKEAFMEMANGVNSCAVLKREDGRYIAAVKTGNKFLTGIEQAITEEFDAEEILDIQIDSPMDSFFNWTVRVEAKWEDDESRIELVELNFVALY